MKRILIIGAGFLQSFVIKKAKEMGYYTIAIDKNPDSIGFKYADKYSTIDIVNQEACLKYALSEKIDGVLTAATDYGVLSSAYIAKKMNLPGLDYEVASNIKNKYIVRKVLFENNVDEVSQHFEVRSMKELELIKEHITFPVMVKPCDGSGSKGAQKVDSYSQLGDACNTAINSSLTKKVLIEDFIEGKEFGVESFVHSGEVHILGVIGKFMTSAPNYAELGHYMPSNLEIEDKVKSVVKKAIKALGVNFGAVNMDILITKDNKVCIIDVGARMGGNLIGSHIIPIGTGISYIETLIKSAVGDKIRLTKQQLSKSVATRLLALKPGKVLDIPEFQDIEEQFAVDIYDYINIGDTIREYKNNLDGMGYIVGVSHNIQEVIERVSKVRDLIDKSIVRK